MPAIEPRDTFGFVLRGDAGLVERSVAWMLELSFCKSFMVVDRAVANELDLWDSGNGLQVRMKDGLLGILSLVVSVSIVLSFGIKCLREHIT